MKNYVFCIILVSVFFTACSEFDKPVQIDDNYDADFMGIFNNPNDTIKMFNGVTMKISTLDSIIAKNKQFVFDTSFKQLEANSWTDLYVGNKHFEINSASNPKYFTEILFSYSMIEHPAEDTFRYITIAYDSLNTVPRQYKMTSHLNEVSNNVESQKSILGVEYDFQESSELRYELKIVDTVSHQKNKLNTRDRKLTDRFLFANKARQYILAYLFMNDSSVKF